MMSPVDSEVRMSNTFRRLTAFAIAAALQGSLAGVALAQEGIRRLQGGVRRRRRVEREGVAVELHNVVS